jgi:hypothetical protein
MGVGVRPYEGAVQLQTLAVPSMAQVAAVSLTPTAAIELATTLIKVARQVSTEARKK